MWENNINFRLKKFVLNWQIILICKMATTQLDFLRYNTTSTFYNSSIPEIWNILEIQKMKNCSKVQP